MDRPKFTIQLSMIGERVSGTACRLIGDRYYRDGGDWYTTICSDSPLTVYWTYKSQKIKVVECTELEWREDNGVYAPQNV